MQESTLIVDDEAELLNSIARNLDRKYYIHTAGSAAGGLELPAESGPCAVVMSDLHMPVMDGRELLSKMRRIILNLGAMPQAFAWT